MRGTAQSPIDWRVVGLAGVLAGGVITLNAQLPSPWWLVPGLVMASLRPWRRSLWLALALVAWIWWQHAQVLQARLPLAQHGAERSLRGQIVGVPEQDAGVSRFLLRSEEFSDGVLRLAWYRDAPPLAAGQCWQLRVRLRVPRGSVNPGGLDYEGWLFRQRVLATGTVRTGAACGPATGLAALRQRWAQSVTQRLGSGTAAATINALSLGVRDGLRDDDWEVLRHTGTSHLFAISGLHLGLLAALGFWLGQGLWRLLGYRYSARAASWAAPTAASLGIGYAAMAGFGVPVQRALVMCLLGVLAASTGRWRDPLQILAVAVVVVLGIDPLAISAPGFWLSFVAAAGILLWLNWRPRQPAWRSLLEIQLLLGLLLLPLSLLFFGGSSLAAMPINLLLVPLFALLLPLVMLASLLHPLPGGEGLLQAVCWLLDQLWWLLATLAENPAAYLSSALPPTGILLLALLGGFWLLLPLGLGARWPGLICLLPALLYQAERPPPGALWLDVLDVGQGQSVLLRTHRHQLLYDAGPAFPGGFDAGRMMVVPSLNALGVRRLDALLISHADSDHAGGTDAVLAALPVMDHIGAGGRACRAGEQWVWDEVQFQLLHPPDGAWGRNDGSCVLQVTDARGARALLAGDIEALAERDLLARHSDLQAQVLLVPHHGSASSSSAAFITAVAPRVAIASVGFANRWAFPRAEVRARYAAAGVELLTTAGQGGIRIELGAEPVLRSARGQHSRIWRYPPEPLGCDHDARGDRLSCPP